MNLRQIIETLDELQDLDDDAQLLAMDKAVAQLDEPPPLEAAAPMFRVFERFPSDDGYETFWTLLHTLEATPGYEAELVKSIARQPNEFNTLMVNRLLNAGVTHIGERSLLGLLKRIAADERTPAEVSKTALKMISAHNDGRLA